MATTPRLTVDVLRVDEVPASITWQAVTLMRSEWPSLFADGLRWIDRPFEPDVDPVHLVVRHAGVLVSHAVVLRVPDDVHGTGLGVAGLASVLTSPPFRGEGHATAVLRAANRLLDEGGFDVAGLFCSPALEPFYERFGWVTCPGGTVEDGEPEPSTDLRMMRFLSDAGRRAERSLRDEPMRVRWSW
jgi:GNAT superfamily N-acetyltransferase